MSNPYTFSNFLFRLYSRQEYIHKEDKNTYTMKKKYETGIK